MKKLAVIGGGAAGLACAVAAGERAQDSGLPLDIRIYERDDRVGRSILATGNGRCNFSNAHPYVEDYRNDDFVEEALFGLNCAYGRGATDRDRKIVRENGDVVHAFFYKHGLMWRQEDDGRQYPCTNKASTVVDILRASVAQAGAMEACEREVREISVPREAGKPFTLRMADGVLERADVVVIACGGRALQAIDVASCNLSVVKQRPVLGPLRVADAYVPVVRELDNIRVRCTVSLVRPKKGGQGEKADGRVVAVEKGELLFRKYGVSGICVFNLSRFAQAGDELRVSFLDGASQSDTEHYLFSRRKLLAGRFRSLTCADVLRGLVLPRIGEAVLKQAGLKVDQQFTKAEVPLLAKALSGFTLEVAGMGDEGICQVIRGGFDVSSFDPHTMQARNVDGLYAAGEALDVDGPCGGYNLHWAWTSGLLAGLSAADALAMG